jgi:hypothetical protein
MLSQPRSPIVNAISQNPIAYRTTTNLNRTTTNLNRTTTNYTINILEFGNYEKTWFSVIHVLSLAGKCIQLTVLQ